MRMGGVFPDSGVSTLGRDVLERGMLLRCEAEEKKVKVDALQKVEEAKDANTAATLKMMDRHNEMVKKSQELYKERARRRAIELQDKKRREEHGDMLAEMAIRNAERHDLLEALRLEEHHNLSGLRKR